MRWVLFTLLMNAFSVRAQIIDTATYLQQNSVVLDLEDNGDFSSFAMLDSVVPDYNFFFTGEIHTEKVYVEWRWKMLQYLYDHADVRYLILEVGFAFSELLNEYLANGDTAFLNQAIRNTPYCSEESIAFLERVYKFNQTVKAGEEISFIGIDLEHNPWKALTWMQHILPDNEIPEKIQKYIKWIKGHDPENNFYYGVGRNFKVIHSLIHRKPELFQGYLGENFEHFKMVVDNIYYAHYFNSYRRTISNKVWKLREEQIYRNLITILPEHTNGNFYAQFGNLHVLMTEVHSFSPTLANRLQHNEDSPFKGQVLSIATNVKLTSRIFKKNSPVYDFENTVNGLIESNPGKELLFRLDNNGSPFSKRGENYQFIFIEQNDEEETWCEDY